MMQNFRAIAARVELEALRAWPSIEVMMKNHERLARPCGRAASGVSQRRAFRHPEEDQWPA
jgi:hypothetical protein